MNTTTKQPTLSSCKLSLLPFSPLSTSHRSRSLPQGAIASTSFSAPTHAYRALTIAAPPCGPLGLLGFREKPVYRSFPGTQLLPHFHAHKERGTEFVSSSLKEQTVVVTLIPSPVPPHPYIVAKYTHFYLATNPQAAIDALATSLRSCGADFLLKKSKCKFKGSYTSSSHRRIDFVARVWSSRAESSDTRLLVEFTRRKGDTFEWQSFFGKVRDALDAEMPGLEGGGSRPERCSNSTSTDPPSGVCLEHLAPLVSMLSSSIASVQLEAIRQLACLSQCAEQAGVMCEGALVQQLRGLLKSPHADVRRCAAATMANLFRVASSSQLSSEFSEEQIALSVDVIGALLSSPVDGFSYLQTRRHAVDALANLCANSSFAAIVQKHGGVRALQQASKTELGTRTLRSARQALATLGTNATPISV